MPLDLSEKNFEETIEGALLGCGFRERQPADYDRASCLDLELMLDFIRSTQIEMWHKLRGQLGDQVRDQFMKRLVKEIESRGILSVLLKGVDGFGCHFSLAFFKPETQFNDEHRRLYRANIFSIIRQVHYSETSGNSIDLVLFLNGLPIFTAELKNPEKGQDVQNAIQQYKQNRDPKEPLLAFGRCLAHFAVDTDFAFMTTRLQKGSTRFLPFNKGHQDGAGNPLNPVGFKTEYLWREIWQPDSILEIINHFIRSVDLLDEDGNKTGKKGIIFPRYHQLDAVRRMVADARANGAGQTYLVEHSAGSGKSNTIAWLAHQLAGLHNDQDNRVFDTIIIITDRRVLDQQLRQTVLSFEQTKGLVSTIEKHKAKELADALGAGKDIIVTTLQTFPFVTEKIGKVKGQQFAVIIDEAHSSQTGEASRSLKRTLAVASMEEAAEADQAEGSDEEDEINEVIERQMKEGGRLPNVSYFAFTATPKPKTMELFGTPLPDGSYHPFSLYSMRQAIEEKFILDVLRNYSTFAVNFALNKRIQDDPRFPKKKSIMLMKSYADLHEHGIRTKTEIIVEHFMTQVKERIGGLAKAMIVTRSRLHAVRFKQAFDRILKEKNVSYRALVAFSGTVKDPDSSLEYTEAEMNGFPETQTASTFKQSKYRFVIVAEKFQTGFDQPLLHTMYVDKKLSGVNAVQTLSRLNRMYPGKDDTFVLDFANTPEEIQEAFQRYYQTTILTEATDPNKLYDIKRKVEECHVYGRGEVDAFAMVYFAKQGTQQKCRAILDPVVETFITKGEETDEGKDAQERFRQGVTNFVRLYSFLSHILQFTDVELEKTYQFLRLLRPLLPMDRERLPLEVIEKINMDSYSVRHRSTGDIALIKEDGELHPIEELGDGRSKEDETVPLSEIIKYINDNFGTDFTDADKVKYFADDMERRLHDQEGLRQALNPQINPSEDVRKLAFREYFGEVLEDMIDANTDIYRKIVEDERFGDIFGMVMFKRMMQTFNNMGVHK